MTFSTAIKEEIAKVDAIKTEYIAELSAFMRNNAYIDHQLIRIYTENNAIARRIFKLIKYLYDLNAQVTVRRNFNFKKNFVYLIELRKDKDKVLKDLSLINEEGYFINIPRTYIISDTEEKASYLRGLFLARGSINDPKKASYHLEFLLDDDEYAFFIEALLNEYNLNSKVIKRVKGYMVYLKEADKISDFLRLIKAYQGVLSFEEIRVYRDKKNLINRLNNCEQANVEKTINAALRQLNDINLIDCKMGLDILDDKLKEVALYRLKYPESSLLELSNIINLETGEKMTKSCLNHRFRKLKEMAFNIRKQKPR